MNPAIITMFLFLLLTTVSYSQNREVVVTRGFENSALAADTLPGQHWVFATLSSPAAGAIYQDTITLWITDSTGRITQSMTVHPPLAFERYEIYDLVSLRDTSMLLIYRGGDCDACCYGSFIENWNTDGTFTWRLDLPEYYEPPFAISSVSPSLLYVLSGNTVFAVDASTGQILWTEVYTNDYPSHARFIHGTPDIMAFHYNSIAFYKYDSLGIPGYSMITNQAITGNLYNHKSSRDGNIYAYSPIAKKVLRINTELELTPVADYESGTWDFTPTEIGVITLIKDGNDFYLLKFDTLGQLQSTYQIKLHQLVPYKIWNSNDRLGVTGVYKAGANSGSSTTSAEGWFRTYDLDSLADHLLVYSVAITDIEQGEPVVHDSIYINEFNYVGYLNNIHGGDFRIQVKNTGDQRIESFRINYHFGNDWFFWWCGLDQVKNVQYTVQLEPGESTWVEFGDIQSNNMFTVPLQFCFWTSGPADRPDDAPGDDKYCTTWIVPATDPKAIPLLVKPNPAEDVITIDGISNIADVEVSIYSLDGKVWLQQILQPINGTLRIQTHTMPAGYYVLRLQDYSTSLVIQRH